MTATVTQVTSSFLHSNAALVNGAGIIAVLLLISLLIERVLLDAYSPTQVQKRGRSFDPAIWSLLMVMGVITLIRLLQILQS